MPAPLTNLRPEHPPRYDAPQTPRCPICTATMLASVQRGMVKWRCRCKVNDRRANH